MPGYRSSITFSTIVFNDRTNRITILDQTRLPQNEIYQDLLTIDDVFHAIRGMKVRGAPLIGVTAAYGIALASNTITGPELIAAADHLRTARPTAVNLGWAIDRMKNNITGQPGVREKIVEEARNIEHEDKESCRRIGENGARLLRDSAAVMVHCNAGALATSGIGTALGIIYTAASQGKSISVFASETRPLLQGARLTSWELTRNNIETCVICDTMLATYVPFVSAILVGADRIAANGDTANKVGTCGLAIIAKYYNIPFYVAAPVSSFDLTCPTGHTIAIEHRDEQEVRSFNKQEIVAPRAKVANPAFDITPAELIAAIITENGIIDPPCEKTIQDVVGTIKEVR